ncbi:FAD-binding oxidoreductase [Ramlibacter terrae]|uniref:FAD-binding oxidoreductase n=1 Tax=Ramlibacter terrae TaxID=2732511 RepID=A0ABX6P4W2_9BURK|nr:FAD-binding oxidoreductase [Ramlibacter terrae]
MLWTRDGRMRAQAGARLQAIDAVTRPTGFELRMHSSTRRAATIGGFVGGGHAGVGSCAWGILRDRGNILGLEVVSVEEEPRTVQLTGDRVNLVHHAYGSNGIITEVELPLAPPRPRREHIVVFPEFMTAVRFAHALATSDGIPKKLVSVLSGRSWSMMSGLQPYGDAACDGLVLAMVAHPFADAFADLVRAFGGRITVDAPEGEGPYRAPIYEFSWGHTRFHINRTQPDIITTVGLYGPRCSGDDGAHLPALRPPGRHALRGEAFRRPHGLRGMPLFAYRGEAHGRRDARHGRRRRPVANNHTFLVKEGGMKPLDGEDAAFKRAMDPHDLMNPGKLRFEAPPREEKALPSAGWKFREAA